MTRLGTGTAKWIGMITLPILALSVSAIAGAVWFAVKEEFNA